MSKPKICGYIVVIRSRESGIFPAMLNPAEPILRGTLQSATRFASRRSAYNAIRRSAKTVPRDVRDYDIVPLYPE